jgi:hypothetical protein
LLRECATIVLNGLLVQLLLLEHVDQRWFICSFMRCDRRFLGKLSRFMSADVVDMLINFLREVWDGLEELIEMS